MDNQQPLVGTAKPRILIAEDQVDQRLMLQDWLEMRGFDVYVASDGQEALILADRHPFEVVVTDLRMPRGDGFFLLSRLKERDPRIQVIFLSGAATKTDAIEALREGRSFDFLEKPLHDLRRLERVIHRALEYRASLPPSPPRLADPAELEGLIAPHLASLADQPRLLEALRYIASRFRETIGLADVAQHFGYTPSYLTNLMRRKTGKTVQQWVITFRLTEAQRLLAMTDWSIPRIAEEVGYQDPSYFHRQFRQLSGLPPQSWRETRR